MGIPMGWSKSPVMDWWPSHNIDQFSYTIQLLTLTHIWHIDLIYRWSSGIFSLTHFPLPGWLTNFGVNQLTQSECVQLCCYANVVYHKIVIQYEHMYVYIYIIIHMYIYIYIYVYIYKTMKCPGFPLIFWQPQLCWSNTHFLVSPVSPSLVILHQLL